MFSVHRFYWEGMVVVRNPFAKTYRVKCPDGTTRNVYKEMDDALPLGLRGSIAKYAASGKDGLGAISANISGEHTSKVENLLVAIDSKNNSLIMKFRAAYLVYTTDPCGQSEYLANQVKQLIEMHDRLTEVEVGTQSLVAIIKSQPKATDLILTQFRQLVVKLGPTLPELNEEAARLAIEGARNDAQRWINPNDVVEAEVVEADVTQDGNTDEEPT
jgi:hypothetical protein